MNKILATGIGLAITAGLGFCCYKIARKKRTVETDTVRKESASAQSIELQNNQEVDMATNRAAFYAATMNTAEVDLDAIASDYDSFENLLPDLMELQLAGKFYIKQFNVVGFIVKTRYGNMVVWNDLEGEDDFEFKAPDRLLSLLPVCPNQNFKHYLEIGIILEQLLGDGVGGG